jgi:hypothetical protein
LLLINNPPQAAKLGLKFFVNRGDGGKPGKNKEPLVPGAPRRSVSKIAKADSTSVFSGIFPVSGDIRFFL